MNGNSFEKQNFNKNNEISKEQTPVDLESENLRLKKELENKEEIIKNLESIFSLATHDIRNSIFNIVGFTDLLEERIREKLEEESIYFTNVIRQSSNSSLHLIEELSGWAKLQFNLEKNESVNLNLTEEVYRSIDSLMSKIQKKGIVVENNVDSKQEVFFDQNILRAVIRNIVSNAVKFTNENGLISISSTEDSDSVMIYIKDNGVGMSKEKIEKLFKSKVESGSLGTNNEKGLGIGLSLCKNFINKKGGEMIGESEGEGKGSTFIVKIPKETK